MTEAQRLRLRLLVLVAFGFIAYKIDAWAIEDSHFIASLIYLVILVADISTEITDIIKGQLKAGPDIKYRQNAMAMPTFQIFFSIYLMCASIFVFISAINESSQLYLNSPFWVWLVSLPVFFLAFVAEYRVN